MQPSLRNANSVHAVLSAILFEIALKDGKFLDTVPASEFIRPFQETPNRTSLVCKNYA